MPYLSHLTGETPSADQPDLYYRDYGSGPETIVLVHGWPFSLDMWEHQWTTLPEQGYRVVAYDRRGFGKSGKPFDASKPLGGYDYDTLASDTERVLEALDLHDVTLVGFSMGGGEVARYLGNYGAERVARANFVSSVTPYMQQASDNPDGVDAGIFQGMRDGLREDRAGFLQAWAKKFYGAGILSKPISDAWLDYTFNKVMEASPVATLKCVDAFAQTDFRDDLRKVNIPTMFCHGADDQIVPFEASAARVKEFVSDALVHKYDGAPHGLPVTHAEKYMGHLRDFIRDTPTSGSRVSGNGDDASRTIRPTSGVAGSTIA